MEHTWKEFGIELCALSNLMWRRIGDHMREDGLGDVTVMHGVIIGYLADHPETYQRDLEGEFQVNRSTITKVVQAMERRGYIRRESTPQDKRLKRLVLTELGQELSERLWACVENTNREFMEAMTPEEGKAFIASMQKMRKKLE